MSKKFAKDLEIAIEHIQLKLDYLKKNKAFSGDPSSFEINFNYEISKLGSGTIANSVVLERGKK